MKVALIHLLAVFRLMFLDTRAVEYLNTEEQFVKKSLFIPILCTAFNCFIFSEFITGKSAALFTPQVWVVYFLASTIGWVSYLLIARKITILIDRPTSFYRYVVAFCWSAPVQSLILTPSLIFQFYAPEDSMVKSMIISMVFTFVYVLQWGIAKTTLKLNGLSAVGIVILFDLISDFMPTMVVQVYALSLSASSAASSVSAL